MAKFGYDFGNEELNKFMEKEGIQASLRALTGVFTHMAEGMKKQGVTLGHDPRILKFTTEIAELNDKIATLDREKCEQAATHQVQLELLTAAKDDLSTKVTALTKDLAKTRAELSEALANYRAVQKRDNIQAQTIAELEKDNLKLKRCADRLQKMLDAVVHGEDDLRFPPGGSSQMPPSDDEQEKQAAKTLSALATTTTASASTGPKKPATPVHPPAPAAPTVVSISSESDKEDEEKKRAEKAARKQEKAAKKAAKEERKKAKEEKKRAASPSGSDADSETDNDKRSHKKQKKTDVERPPTPPAPPAPVPAAPPKKRAERPAQESEPEQEPSSKKARSEEKKKDHAGVIVGELRDRLPVNGIFAKAREAFELMIAPLPAPEPAVLTSAPAPAAPSGDGGLGMKKEDIFNTFIKKPEAILSLKEDQGFKANFSTDDRTVLRECGTFRVPAGRTATFALCSKQKTSSFTLVLLPQPGLFYTVREEGYQKDGLVPPASGTTKFAAFLDDDASKDCSLTQVKNVGEYVAVRGGGRVVSFVGAMGGDLFVTAFLEFKLTKQNASRTYAFFMGLNNPEDLQMPNPTLPGLCKMTSKISASSARRLHNLCKPIHGMYIGALLDFIKSKFVEQLEAKPRPKKPAASSSSSSSKKPSDADEEGDEGEDPDEYDEDEDYTQDSFMVDDREVEEKPAKSKAPARQEKSIEDKLREYKEQQSIDLEQWLEDNTAEEDKEMGTKAKVISAKALSAFRERQAEEYAEFEASLKPRVAAALPPHPLDSLSKDQFEQARRDALRRITPVHVPSAKSTEQPH
jgi:hypothetical protein